VTGIPPPNMTTFPALRAEIGEFYKGTARYPF
jgi:hypothetical protein